MFEGVVTCNVVHGYQGVIVLSQKPYLTDGTLREQVIIGLTVLVLFTLFISVRWMCVVKLQDRVPSKELRGRLELEDIISVLQRNRLQWYAIGMGMCCEKKTMIG